MIATLPVDRRQQLGTRSRQARTHGSERYLEPPSRVLVAETVDAFQQENLAKIRRKIIEGAQRFVQLDRDLLRRLLRDRRCRHIIDRTAPEAGATTIVDEAVAQNHVRPRSEVRTVELLAPCQYPNRRVLHEILCRRSIARERSGIGPPMRQPFQNQVANCGVHVVPLQERSWANSLARTRLRQFLGALTGFRTSMRIRSAHSALECGSRELVMQAAGEFRGNSALSMTTTMPLTVASVANMD
jgi:hypothetical protein